MTINRIIVGELQTNCYIIESKGKGIIIDPGAESEEILKKSKEIKIILILLTHNHFDHYRYYKIDLLSFCRYQ